MWNTASGVCFRSYQMIMACNINGGNRQLLLPFAIKDDVIRGTEKICRTFKDPAARDTPLVLLLETRDIVRFFPESVVLFGSREIYYVTVRKHRAPN